MAIGDHLFVQYPTFKHHGVDIGDGTVVEYGGKGTGFMSVRRVWREHFIARGPAFIKHYPPGSALPPVVTAQRPLSRVGEREYDLANNNCEHLANWSKTGHHYSEQAQSAKEAIVIGLFVGLLALLAGAAG